MRIQNSAMSTKHATLFSKAELTKDQLVKTCHTTQFRRESSYEHVSSCYSRTKSGAAVSDGCYKTRKYQPTNQRTKQIQHVPSIRDLRVVNCVNSNGIVPMNAFTAGHADGKFCTKEAKLKGT
jgi:hypothetical protein